MANDKEQKAPRREYMASPVSTPYSFYSVIKKIFLLIYLVDLREIQMG